MPFKMSVLALSAAGSIVGAGVTDWVALQQGTQAPGGQPSAAPGQKNPQPRPISPGPSAPVQPVQTPGQPATANQPGVERPGVNPGQNGNNGTVNPNLYQRPFAFVSPAVEARYNENTRRLVAIEQRLAKTNADLTKRLGEARALTGERQTAATFDILQQILKEQAAMQQYLVRARTTWTGDMDGSTALPEDDYSAGNEGAGQPIQPGTQPQPADPSGRSSGTQPPR